MTVDPAVLKQVSDELQLYVYMLVDPRNGIPFYVGKGQGIRAHAHLAEAMIEIDEDDEERSRKRAAIREIWDAKLEPEVWILRYGLNKQEYTAVEAATIDLLMTFPLFPLRSGEARIPLAYSKQLTNARREQAKGHGITPLQVFIDEYAAPDLNTDKPLLLITLNGWVDQPDGEQIAGGRVRFGAGWRPEWLVSSVRRASYAEIGNSVSAWWTVNPQRVESRGIKHVVAVHRGVTRALFAIKPGSWETDFVGRNKGSAAINRSAFQFEPIDSGPLFDEVVGPHGHRTPPRLTGDQGSFHYWLR